MKNNLLEITILSTFYVKNPKIGKIGFTWAKIGLQKADIDFRGGGQKNFVLRIT